MQIPLSITLFFKYDQVFVGLFRGENWHNFMINYF
jgi:hypothetical protein